MFSKSKSRSQLFWMISCFSFEKCDSDLQCRFEFGSKWSIWAHVRKFPKTLMRSKVWMIDWTESIPNGIGCIDVLEIINISKV